MTNRAERRAALRQGGKKPLSRSTLLDVQLHCHSALTALECGSGNEWEYTQLAVAINMTHTLLELQHQHSSTSADLSTIQNTAAHVLEQLADHRLPGGAYCATAAQAQAIARCLNLYDDLISTVPTATQRIAFTRVLAANCPHYHLLD